MRIKITLILFVLVFLSGSVVEAAPSYMKNRADKVTWWNKISDSLATIGQDEYEKKRTLRERRSVRQEERLRKARIKASKKRVNQLGYQDDQKWWQK